MSAEQEPQSIEVHASMAQLIDVSTIYTVAWPIHAYTDSLRESGFKGMEVMPMRTRAGMQISSGRISEDDKQFTSSLHQSYRGENLGQAIKGLVHGNILAFGSYLLLPERVASLNDLDKLQNALGKQMPVVLYPGYKGEKPSTSHSFGEKLFQFCDVGRSDLFT